jgi:hypothetical protein
MSDFASLVSSFNRNSLFSSISLELVLGLGKVKSHNDSFLNSFLNRISFMIYSLFTQEVNISPIINIAISLFIVIIVGNVLAMESGAFL